MDVSLERYRQLVCGTAINVTREELISVGRNALYKRAYFDYQNIRANYKQILPEGYFLLETQCKKCGLNPDEHELRWEYHNGKRLLCVDGYWVHAYKLLFTEHPEEHCLTEVVSVKKYLMDVGDADSLALLLEKYRFMYERSEKRKREFLGIDDDVQNETISFSGIDGVSIKTWKALYDANFIPQISHLKYWIRLFEERGDPDKSKLLKEKYAEMLEGKKEEELPAMEADEAKVFAAYILSEEYRQKLIGRNRNRGDNNA